MNNDGVKLSCAKNGSVMKLVLTSDDKQALIARYWSLYNNNATGSKELDWINETHAPYCAFVWTNRQRLKRGLKSALDMKHGAASYDRPEDEEAMEKFLEEKAEEWISSIEKEDYHRFQKNHMKVHDYSPKSKTNIEKMENQYHGTPIS